MSQDLSLKSSRNKTSKARDGNYKNFFKSSKSKHVRKKSPYDMKYYSNLS